MSNNIAKTRVYFILVVCVCVCLCLIHISRSRWWWKWSAPALLKPLCIDKLLPHQRTWNTHTHTHPQISQCTYSSTFRQKNINIAAVSNWLVQITHYLSLNIAEALHQSAWVQKITLDLWLICCIHSEWCFPHLASAHRLMLGLP